MSRKPKNALIDKKELRHLADLSKLSLSLGEEGTMAGQLAQILDYFKVLDGAPVKGIPPTYHVRETENVFREDEVVPFDADEMLKDVPHKKGRLVRAPKVF